ncbi:MAG: hypothetical protein MPK31_02435 [Gammaproteobacteria bacterium]|nr:hypothetical protein [Gammaproteobacteria bacterium]MDA7967780.1 hypothetical protein [Gammaproteobacteria bacterium]
MKIFLKALVFAGIFFAGMQNAAANPFAHVDALICEFSPGFTADWEQGGPVLVEGKFGEAIIFDSIDFAKGTARMRGNNASPKLVVSADVLGITFLEKLDGGTVVVTTVFANHHGGDSSRYSAVHSRHMTSLLLHPLPSQYHGTCKELK